MGSPLPGSGTKEHGNAVISGVVSIGKTTESGSKASLAHSRKTSAMTQQRVSGVEIGDNNVLREYCTIHRDTKEGTNTRVGSNNLLMVGSHLGHNTWLGE